MSLSRKEILEKSIRFIKAVNEGMSEEGITRTGFKEKIAITNYFQDRQNCIIKERSITNLLVEIMDDPQLVEGKIIPASPMGQEILDILVSNIKAGASDADCEKLILSAYQQIFNYILDYYLYDKLDDKEKKEIQPPAEPKTDLSSSLFTLIRSVILRPEDFKQTEQMIEYGLKRQSQWDMGKTSSTLLGEDRKKEKEQKINIPVERYGINLEETKLHDKDKAKILGFFKKAEQLHLKEEREDRVVLNHEKAKLIQEVQKRLGKYKKELKDDQKEQIKYAIIRKIGPF